jgi:YbgC/YbaW family acyl-CoA thioester hydrolase
MERVKVNLPENFSFKTKIPIRINDVNYGGHVGNDSYLSLIQEARLQFFKHYGYTETNLEGLGVIMIDAAIEYKAELFYGDTVEISVEIDGISRVGFDLFYLIERKNGDIKQVSAKAKTGILCFDYLARKVVPVPVAAISKFSSQS